MTKRAAVESRGSGLKADPTMRLHLWFETDKGVIFGLGRLMLLKEVEASGSLKAAAERLGMSYRGAWGKLKRTEEALGQPLIQKGPSRRAGYRLTAFGEDLVRQFDLWFNEVEEFALNQSKAHLPFKLERYA